VTTYCDEKPADPDSNILHVVGRTYNEPHKYFYRRYTHREWTPWKPVGAEVEGDHVVAVVWRQRLNLFWLTFLEKRENQASDETKFQEGLEIKALKPRRVVELQLNWSECCQGQWTPRTSGGFGEPIHQGVPDDFKPEDVFVHVSKEWEGEEERGVTIHCHFDRALVDVPLQRLAPFLEGKVQNSASAVLSYPLLYAPRAASIALSVQQQTQLKLATRVEIKAVDHAFRVISKNCPPRAIPGEAPRTPPFALDSSNNARATRHVGTGELEVIIQDQVVTTDGKLTSGPPFPRTVVQQSGPFALVFSGNYLAASSSDSALLERPFFFENERHTLFVEPALAETTFEKWETWVAPPLLNPRLEADVWWNNLMLVPELPAPQQGVPIDLIGPEARVAIQPTRDWLTGVATAVDFDGRPIGQGGRLAVPCVR
jgi:hypothetical protein